LLKVPALSVSKTSLKGAVQPLGQSIVGISTTNPVEGKPSLRLKKAWPEAGRRRSVFFDRQIATLRRKFDDRSFFVNPLKSKRRKPGIFSTVHLRRTGPSGF
jgi:hypothetical protein